MIPERVFTTQVPAAERTGLLLDLRMFLNSDSAMAGCLAHDCHVMQQAALAFSASVPASKRAFAANVLKEQCKYCAEAIRDFCRAAQWADVEPVSRPSGCDAAFRSISDTPVVPMRIVCTAAV